MSRDKIISDCRKLISAFENGDIGQTRMPEDSNPGFSQNERELCLSYFSLPMALNYQRDSYKLWEAALKTYLDDETRVVFNVKAVANMDEEKLRRLLMKYKVALQPNKHINTWKRICKTVFENWGSFEDLFEKVECDFIVLRNVVQGGYKKGFPYLSGPKIFNYWSFIIQKYGSIVLKNSEFIEVAPDTHVTKCSVILGVIENENIPKDDISKRWREILKGSGINPIDIHSPLWFWSRNGFLFEL